MLCGLLVGNPVRLHADNNAYKQAADRALAWLSQSQNADGSWGSGIIRFLLTSEAADTFRVHHRRGETYRRAITWLEGHTPSNHDFAARRSRSLVPNDNDLSGEFDAIAQGKNDAGFGLTGWGLYPSLNGSTLDTVEVFDAYLEYDDSTGAAEAANWLIANHLSAPQGGWPAIGGGEADALATARVVVAGQKAAGRYPDLDVQFPNAVTIVESLAQSSSDPRELAIALRALVSLGTSPQTTTTILDSLVDQQLADGSWSSDEYSTMLVSRLLATVLGLDGVDRFDVVRIPDVNLRLAINDLKGGNRLDEILVGDLATIESLNLSNQDIDSLEGLEVATSLKSLDLSGNGQIDSISPLLGLTGLVSVDFAGVSLSDRDDTDRDGLVDAAELAAGTDPLRADSDADGVVDGADASPLDPAVQYGTGPIVVADVQTTSEGITKVIDVLQNDSDGNGEALTIEAVTQSRFGEILIIDNKVKYEPNAGYSGEDVFTYTAADESGNDGSASVVVTVTPANDNDPPQPVADSMNVIEDLATEAAVLANDSDPNLDPIEIVAVTQPSHGGVSFTDTTIAYTPAADYSGSDSFFYTVSDPFGAQATALVDVTVSAVNDEPVALDDTANTLIDVAVTIDVLGNDEDVDGDSLSIDSFTQPDSGVVTEESGMLHFQPANDFVGQQVFEYIVSDGEGGQATGTVTVNVVEPTASARYFILNNHQASGDIVVMSLTDANSIVAGSTTHQLSEFESGVISASEISLDLEISGAGDFAIGSDAPGTDLPVPEVMSGTEFVVPHYRGAHSYLLLSPYDAATVEITVGGATSVVELTQGQVTTFDAGNEVGIAGLISSDIPIVVSHTAEYIGEDADTYPVPRAATEIWGIRSQYVVLGAFEDDTEVFVTASNGEQETIYLDAGESVEVSASVLATQGTGDSIYLRSDKLIGAIQIADADGDDATGFWPRDLLSIKYGVPLDTQYVAVVCPYESTSVTLTDGQSVETQDCSANADRPGKAYFGVDEFADGSISGTAIQAGATLESTAPVYVIYEPSASDDEHNLLGSLFDPGNSLPVANPDSVKVDEEQSIEIDVLGNDTDADGDRLFITSLTRPLVGTVNVSGNVVAFEPPADYNGVTSFAYTVSDHKGTADTTTVTITVDAVNDAPVALDDSATVNEDDQVLISVLDNDSDIDEETLTIQTLSGAAFGQTTIQGDEVRYQPDPDFAGTDTFSYVIVDAGGLTATADVEITITAVDDAPNATGDSASVNEDQSITIDVLTNDNDADGDALTIQSLTPAGSGVATHDGQQIQYVPNADYNGIDQFTYTVVDPSGLTATASVSIAILPVNDPPVGVLDEVSVDEDSAITFDPRSNDYDPDGEIPQIEAVQQPGNGAVSFTDLQLTYIPEQNYSGVDQFTYTIVDASGASSNATVNVTVNPVNDQPMALDDHVESIQDVSIFIDVIKNDTDADGDELAVVDHGVPDGGTVSVVDGKLRYTPEEGFSGTDQFTYTIGDASGATATANVIVSISDDHIKSRYFILNDRHSRGPINAMSLSENLTIHAGSTVIQLDKYEVGAIPAHELIPGAEIVGTGAFAIGSEVAGVDMPVPLEMAGTEFVVPGSGYFFSRNVNQYLLLSPYADARVDIEVDGETSTMLLAEGEVMTFDSLESGEPGTIRSNLPILVANRAYDSRDDDEISEPDYRFGFNYPVAPASNELFGVGGLKAKIGSLEADTTAATFVNGRSNDEVTLQANEDQHAIYISKGWGRHGGAEYDEHRQGKGFGVYVQSDKPVSMIQYDDGEESDSNDDAAVEGVSFWPRHLLSQEYGIPVNAQYVAVACPYEMTTVTLTDGANVTSQPCNVNGQEPGMVFFGSQSDGVRINAGAILESTQPIYVYYESSATNDERNLLGSLEDPDNQNPTSMPDSVSVFENESVEISVLDNDVDADGHQLFITGVSQPANGTVDINGDVIVYSPNADFQGDDTFTYTVSDYRGGVDSATVFVEVQEVNYAPTAINDSANVIEDGSIVIDLIENDLDPDGDVLTLQSVNLGTATFDDRSVFFDAPPDFSGEIQFQYSVADSQGETDIGSVTISVVPVNDPPIAVNDSATTLRSWSAQVDVLSNDIDVDGDKLVISDVSQGASGSVSFTSQLVTYTPAQNFTGVDSFSYTVTDPDGGTAIGYVEIGVVSTNSNPIAVMDAVSTHPDVPVVVDVISNDSDAENDLLVVTSFDMPQNGLATASNGSLIYTPDTGFEGEDGFEYVVSDGNGGSSLGSVTISVTRDAELIAFANRYRIVNDRFVQAAIDATSLVDGLNVFVGDSTYSIDKGDTETIPGTSLIQGAEIYGTGGFSLASSDIGTDLPVPYQMLGTQFGVLTHSSFGNLVSIASPLGDATVEVVVGLDEQYSLMIPEGQTKDVGPIAVSENILIESNIPVVVFTGAVFSDEDDPYSYVYPVPPAQSEVWGINSRKTYVIAVEDDTTVDVFSSDGELTSFMLNAGESRKIELGENAEQGEGSALRVVASSPVNVVQTSDADSQLSYPFRNSVEASAFWPLHLLSDRYGIPIDSQYLSIVCPYEDTEITLIEGATVDARACNAEGDYPGKAYFGSPSDGAHIPSGSILESTKPIYVMLESAITNDEKNLLGAMDLPGNSPPVAVRDQVIAGIDQEVLFYPLDNDTDADGHTLFISQIDKPANGAVDVDGNLVRYTSNEGFFGEDVFTYTVTDHRGGTATGTVTIQIQ